MRRAIAPELRDWVANRMVSAHIRVARAMVLGSWLNAALVVTALWRELASVVLLVFAANSVAAGCHRLWLARGIARGRRQKRAERMIASFELNSWWLGLSLGFLIALWLPKVGPGGQVLLAICGVTQAALAAYMIRTLPRSAAVYILSLAGGLAIGLAQLDTPQAWAAVAVLTVASGLLIRIAFVSRELFVTRILSERELSSTARTVKLLLNEYEESGSDWLFELDGMDRLVNVSPRFAEALGLPAGQLDGKPLVFLFAEGRGRDDLAEALIARRPIRDLVLEVAANAAAAQMWWSISGRPAYAASNDAVAFRGAIADVSVQRLAEGRAHHMAHYDALTGLPNRSLLTQTLAELLDLRGDEAEVALLAIDVDRFKAINDMYGHATGDAFLRELAARLSATVTESGLGGMRHLIARLGGDEFAIVVSGDDSAAQAVRLAEQLLAAVEAPILVDGHEIAGGISIGIALAPEHAVLTRQLMSNADIALYAAKSAGRGSSAMFAPGMDAALHERHTLCRDLRHAVARGQLRLFLQPLVDVATEAMTGYEALLRWEHPERGLILPDSFIPLAEETGLIVPIGEWVIRTALAEAAHWEGGEAIAINLSPIQLGSSNLLPTIVSALAESQLDPARVEFEITESVLLENSDANIEVLRRLHSLGVKIALDDFGTGYSSLNYLLTFPFDKIKIDRRFISDLSTREESRVIVSAVIGLANELGMCTVAEGVEEDDQLDRLREQGCVMVQGWLFGRALPSEDYHPRVIAPAPAAPLALPARARVPSKPAASPRRKRA